MPIHHSWLSESVTAHFICDQCGKSITDGKKALYMYEPDAPNAPTHFAHKGSCDSLLKERLGLKSAPWHDVTELVRRLAESIGMEVKEPGASN